ncbi:MAG: hypothetical protein IKU62_06990 [Ruminiclostridium sp.]|nr:hypothetical protein [Ruminiclostridium sp.]
MKLTFQRLDPAGNITLLVMTPVPREDYQTIAARLLSLPELDAEQVGFLVPPQQGGVVRLEMMGGEFCGNALRSTALHYATSQGFRRSRSFPVEISGYDAPLPVQVNPLTGQVTAEMPLPKEILPCQLFGEPAKAVRIPGILHAISQTEQEPSQEEVRQALRDLTETYDVPAAGIMFWQFRKKAMKPAVYVRDTDSLFYERSCASGSTAVAAWGALNARKDGQHKLDIRQPGGVISTTAVVQGGKLQHITIGGKVDLGPVYDIEF